MEMEMYAIYDRKLGTYGAVWLAPNRAVVTRTLQLVLKGQDTVVVKYPGDFELCLLGTMNDTSGVLTPRERPEVVSSMEVIFA